MEVLQDMLQLLKDQVTSSHSEWLEIIVIILIVLEYVQFTDYLQNYSRRCNQYVSPVFIYAQCSLTCISARYGPRAVDIFFRLACIIYAGLRHGQTAGLTRTSSPSTVTKMTITKVDDLFDGITTHCGSAQFYGYHDPNVHVLLIFVFGIFALVFIYYVSRRRPRCEYGLMILWCVSAYQLLSCANKNSASRFIRIAPLLGH